MRSLAITFMLLLLFAFPVTGHEASTTTSANVEVRERLGEAIPAGLAFRDEDGKSVDLKGLADRPLVIAPVYLSCTHECPLLLTGLAGSMGKMTLVTPGRDFKAVALSFDEKDTPAVAKEKKPNYLSAGGKRLPDGTWTLLTGDRDAIRRFTDAVGYTVQRDGTQFSHPIGLVVIAPGGKIVRYLHGSTFLPFQLTLAVTEASQGKVGTPTGSVLSYCFSYDPLSKSYVFNVLKVVGAAVVLTVVSFFVYLVVTGNKRTS